MKETAVGRVIRAIGLAAICWLAAAARAQPSSAADTVSDRLDRGPAMASPASSAAAAAAVGPLRLHPDDPHYFLFRGRPTVLVTSGEHYGAVLNRAFDCQRYLDTLRADGLNLTRIFTGAYVEHPGAFNVAANTLAPAPGQLVCPWKRSGAPGYRNGGNRFDLNAWDEGYFDRLRGFLKAAAERGIVVEVCLFCPFYGDEQWELSPWHPDNNVNGIGHLPRTDVYTLTAGPELLAIQEAMVRKIVMELNRFDNLYYEICNEPYFGGVTAEWQAHIADVIVEAEAELPQKHLISQNIANGAEQVRSPHQAVSILNFHYASPPDTVVMNYALNRVIGENETGFQGTGDTHYRMEGWEFVLAGGGLYNNLDYSFTVGHEDGSFDYPDTQPGGGTAALRRQLRLLKDFIHRFDFVRMKPDGSAIRGGLQGEQRARVLAEAGKQYAIYVFGGPQVTLALDLPKGEYVAEWLNPVTGKVDRREEITHAGGGLSLASPSYADDIALSVVRREK
jgi:hypothetical protein